MFNLEKYISTFKQNLKTSAIFRDHAKELAQIILDELKELVALGYSEEQAFYLTVKRFEHIKKWALQQSRIMKDDSHLL